MFGSLEVNYEICDGHGLSGRWTHANSDILTYITQVTISAGLNQDEKFVNSAFPISHCHCSMLPLIISFSFMLSSAPEPNFNFQDSYLGN
ncbi:hypothetical protein RJT34_13362 [Clitoria ternatea]|uniref:Uncharacterized protein n=1 Tax=Clitoria ternatea TaxID=43366 RepID=A0AAN9JNT7_CLITE